MKIFILSYTDHLPTLIKLTKMLYLVNSHRTGKIITSVKTTSSYGDQVLSR